MISYLQYQQKRNAQLFKGKPWLDRWRGAIFSCNRNLRPHTEHSMNMYCMQTFYMTFKALKPLKDEGRHMGGWVFCSFTLDFIGESKIRILSWCDVNIIPLPFIQTFLHYSLTVGGAGRLLCELCHGRSWFCQFNYMRQWWIQRPSPHCLLQLLSAGAEPSVCLDHSPDIY